MVMRPDKRNPEELRPLSFELGYLKFSSGSCLARAGDTIVLAAASLEPSPPAWLEGKGKGWITAEYSMLPASTPGRNPRESLKGRPSARSQEISRLVGRSLRMGFDLDALGENTITVDCDVLQADGGTRTLSICAGFMAVYQACNSLQKQGIIKRHPVRQFVGAVSVGIVGKEACADLSYEEDSSADVDANVVATEDGRIVELQMTAERDPLSDEQFFKLLELGKQKIRDIIGAMKLELRGKRV